MATRERRVLEKLFPTFLDQLHVQDVKPYLLSHGMISYAEYEELQIGQAPSLTSQRALAERLLMILMGKGPSCASELLGALEKSVDCHSPQLTHCTLIAHLKRELGFKGLNCKCDRPLQIPRVVVTPEGTVENYSENHFQNEAKDDSSVFVDKHLDLGASNEPVHLMHYKHLDSPSQEKLRVKLASESRQMLEHFTTFVISVSSLLQSKSISTDQVQLALQFRIGSKNIDECIMRRIDEARSIPFLLRAVEPFSSWYNYDLIAYLAKHFGGVEGEAVVSNYESQLQSYFKKLVYECPPFLSMNTTPKEFDECCVKLDWNYTECTVQDITIFKEKLCKLLCQKDPTLFILKSVDEGCVLVTWIIPKAFVGELHSKMLLLTPDLAEEGVIYLRVGQKSVATYLQSVKLHTKSSDSSGYCGSPSSCLSFSTELDSEWIDTVSECPSDTQITPLHASNSARNRDSGAWMETPL